MGERAEAVGAAVVSVLYVAVMAATVLALFPAARTWLVDAGREQAHAWRYGRWLAGRTPPPGWTALLGRDDLPAERPA